MNETNLAPAMGASARIGRAAAKALQNASYGVSGTSDRAVAAAQSARHVPADQPRTEYSKRSFGTTNLIGGIVALGLAASPLHAGELPAMAGESIRLGPLHGVFYYTNGNDGYRVIATIADGEAGVPVRFTATLAEGQSATISVPGKLGEPDQSFEMSRMGGKLTVAKVESISNEAVAVAE